MDDGALIGTARARELVLAEADPLASEPVELSSALGRVLTEQVVSGIDLPPFDASAMDGFATLAGPPEELRVVGESRAGRPAAGAPRAGEAIRISTGAQVPLGAEAVVPLERAGPPRAGASAGIAAERVLVPARERGDHIRRMGEDVRAGVPVLESGTKLGPAEIAVLASLGFPRAPCTRRPRVAVVVTGDELVRPGETLAPGLIHDSNAFALAAQAELAGATVVARNWVGDDLDATVAALGFALDEADVVCVSGGVSVGRHDHVKAALARLGVQERFWGLALKPGKPTWFGVRGATLVFGLPGNPVSAMVIFHLLARPALARQSGRAHPDGARRLATLDAPLARHAAREQAIRCRIEHRPEGLQATPTGPQGSHMLTSMLRADAVALVPAGEGELAAGERVKIEPLGPDGPPL